MEDKHCDRKIYNLVNEARLLGRFKAFCEKNSSVAAKQRIRNIYNNSSDALGTTYNLISNELHVSLSPEECKRMRELIAAYLSKNEHRLKIPDSVTKKLLVDQNGKCAICEGHVDAHSHVDHIVPFKYVGDKLNNNYQLLCDKCNLKKNASLDYQIRFMLGTV